MAQKLPPFVSRDYRMGRITPETLSPYLVPPNSVKDSLNVNFDEVVGNAKVRPGTTQIGTGQHPGADGFLPQGITEFVPGSGATLGSELVTNGTFTGSAAGWTLGHGWTYNANHVIWTALGSEIITNGGFTGSATGWTLTGAWAYNTNKVTEATGTGGTVSQAGGTLTVGLTYRLVFTTLLVGLQTHIRVIVGGVTVSNFGSFPNGTYTNDFVSAATTADTNFNSGSGSSTAFRGSLDDVSLKEVNEGTLSQTLTTAANYTYLVSVNAGGTTGFVTVTLGSDSFNVAAGATVAQHLVAGASGNVSISASSTFDGNVDNVSVKQVLNNYLLVVYNGVSTATLYYWDGVQWQTSNLTALTNDTRNRFMVFGSFAFVTNSANGMASSPDAATWSTGAAANCIATADAKPAYIFRYKQRLLASGDPTFPDRVFFSSIIDPSASPFITWNTTDGTGDYINVNPDDGGNVTGFSENSTFLLIFKNTGMYRMDVVSKTVDPDNIFDVGAVSQEAIVLCQGVTYFFSGNGVYRTNGGYPELISRNGVQDIIDALDPSSWPNVGSGTDGFNVYFSLGQVTLHKNQTNERVLNNVVLKFSVRDQTWSVHAYRDYFGQFTQYTDGNGDLMRGASDAGIVQTINLGVVDITDSIPFLMETQDIDMGDRSHGKGISDKIAVFTDNGLASSFAATQNGTNLKPILMTLNKRVNMGTNINLQGNWFNFRWSGTSRGNPPIFEGFYIEDIDDLGMGDAQGQSQAPIVTQEL